MAKENETANKKGHYFKDMKAELKKVIWPSAKQTTNSTIATIVFTIIIAIIVLVLDLCFDFLNSKTVVPMQQKILSSYGKTVENTTTEENTTTNTIDAMDDASNVMAEGTVVTSDGETSTETTANNENVESQE